MCTTCGCGTDEVRVQSLDGEGAHEHSERHDHDDHHGHGEHTAHTTHTIELEQSVLARNDHLAEHNRAWLAERSVLALNIMSSPGAGKTTLLERTISLTHHTVGVIEGDQETALDAERIRAAGARAVQINTGAGCHLDAQMVQRALETLQPGHGEIVFIENVGNLVCPALFDLGEAAKVVVISVTEGDDKPRKYPHMFSAADLVLVNKIDLLPYVDFDVEKLTTDARRLNPDVEVVPLSARTGDNLRTWLDWLDRAAPQR